LCALVKYFEYFCGYHSFLLLISKKYYMPTEIRLELTPERTSEGNFEPLLAEKLQIKPNEITSYRILKKSIDARSKQIKILLSFKVYINEPAESIDMKFEYQDVSAKKPVIIVGAGPAGIFAALRLIELGCKPVILERGKDVSSRKRDIATLIRESTIDPESNYCFGEGGAGTFSDGKLYTRSQKRGDVNRILQQFYTHGAPEEILYEAHPHIGTDKLPGIIQKMRETIIKYGGEVHFETKVVDILLNSQNKVRAVLCADGKIVHASAVILATGHSARDVYEFLFKSNIELESKSFAMGVRAEHPQELIDSIQYHMPSRGNFLPAATYSLATQVEGRGVYSFCMCPGGFIVPASTANDEMVVNGMSPSHRNSPYANSGIAVEIQPEDLAGYEQYGALGGLRFQQEIERLAFLNGGRGQTAPAQRITDFVKGLISPSLPETSYMPGIISSPMHFWLPEFISNRLKAGFVQFNKMMHGYLSLDGIVVGVESRTSSPVRIPRNKETFEHIRIEGLFPCGEGAGYAGGIVSSAMDGEHCAEWAAKKVMG